MRHTDIILEYGGRGQGTALLRDRYCVRGTGKQDWDQEGRVGIRSGREWDPKELLAPLRLTSLWSSPWLWAQLSLGQGLGVAGCG